MYLFVHQLMVRNCVKFIQTCYHTTSNHQMPMHECQSLCNCQTIKKYITYKDSTRKHSIGMHTSLSAATTRCQHLELYLSGVYPLWVYLLEGVPSRGCTWHTQPSTEGTLDQAYQAVRDLGSGGPTPEGTWAQA